MTDALKKNVPKVTTIAVAAVIANIIWGTPFKLIKVMNTEMKISPEIFGNHYLGAGFGDNKSSFLYCWDHDTDFCKIYQTKHIQY